MLPSARGGATIISAIRFNFDKIVGDFYLSFIETLEGGVFKQKQKKEMKNTKQLNILFNDIQT